MVPPRYQWSGSRSTNITFQRPLRRLATDAVPAAASRRPVAAFCRRLPPHSAGHAEGQYPSRAPGRPSNQSNPVIGVRFP